LTGGEARAAAVALDAWIAAAAASQRDSAARSNNSKLKIGGCSYRHNNVKLVLLCWVPSRYEVRRAAL
jgi:hypothetical protein